MAEPGQVLFLSPSLEAQKQVRAALHGDVFIPFVTGRVEDMAEQLAKGQANLLLVDSAQKKPDALSILKEARVNHPKVARALLAPTLPQNDPEPGLKKAGVWPCGVFTLDLTPAQVQKQMVRHYQFLRENSLTGRLGLPYSREDDLKLDYEASNMEFEVGRIIGVMMEKPDLRLPILPWVAREISALLKKKSVRLEDYVELLGLDAGMAARATHEAIRRSGQPCSTLAEVMEVLKPEGAQALLMDWLDKDYFHAKIPFLEILVRRLWIHTLLTAQVSRMVSVTLGKTQPERNFLLGLLHDLGKWVILELLQEGYMHALWTKRMVNEEFCTHLLNRHHHQYGTDLLKRYELPRCFQEVSRLHNDSDHITAYDDYLVVVYYANLLTQKLDAGLSPYDRDQDLLNRKDVIKALGLDDEKREDMESRAAKLFETLKGRFKMDTQ